MIQSRNDTPDQGSSMSSKKAKEAARQLIEQLPDDMSWSELAYKIAMRASIERGLCQSDAGQFISQEDVERRFGITR
jgi:predicted transcriptional regulator